MGNNEFQSAIVGLISGIISAIITNKFNNRSSIREVYDTTVSRNRMDWLKEIRKELVYLISFIDLYDIFNNSRKIDILENFFSNANSILIKLNLQEELHILLYNQINELKKLVPDFNNKKDDIFIIKESLEFLKREMLKPEWNRVKKEAKGEM